MPRVRLLPAALVAASLGLVVIAPPATAGTDLVVRPGESIQAALDAAPDGAVVTVRPGRYAESLAITRPVTLAADPGAELTPPAAAPVNACTLDPDAHGAMPGVCVVGQLADPTEEASPVVVPVRDVRVSGLTVTGFSLSGVEVYGAEHATLQSVTARGNAGGAVFVGRSSDVVIDGLQATGNAGNGVDLHEGNAGFVVSHSTVTGNRGEGIFVGDGTDGVITHDVVSGNCAGVVALDLALPGGHGVSGLRIDHSDVSRNNLFCPGDDEGSPSMSGNGVVLVGVRDTTVAYNRVVGNVGATDPATGWPANVALGGIALLDASGFTGGSAPTGVVVEHNVVTGNQPFDVLYDGSGAGNTLEHNVCAVSTVPTACEPGR